MKETPQCSCRECSGGELPLFGTSLAEMNWPEIGIHESNGLIQELSLVGGNIPYVHGVVMYAHDC